MARVPTSGLDRDESLSLQGEPHNRIIGSRRRNPEKGPRNTQMSMACLSGMFGTHIPSFSNPNSTSPHNEKLVTVNLSLMICTLPFTSN